VLRLIPGVNPTTAGFALLVIVLLTATLRPLWMAIAVAIASTLSFNFFFFPPIGTFRIAETHNWVSLFAFLAAAVIGSSLSAAAKARERGELAATLLASLSHDLKTPLTAIRVAVENLKGDLPVADRQSQADAAITELIRLTRLFEDLLDMARIDAAAIAIQREWVTPADVVDAAVAHVRHAIDGHAFRVEADADRVVNVDARLASVALAHLLENAARYSPADREIVIDARAHASGFQVSVTDHGPGLDPIEREHLFERFYRGQLAQRTTPGTGMGLAIARGLLNALGGRVWADSVPGGGARFSIEVPGATRPLELKA
jgi:two-component system sensor histidine kinase KdpD